MKCSLPLTFLGLASLSSARRSYRGFSLFRFVPATPEELTKLKERIAEEEFRPWLNQTLDVWSGRPALNATLRLILAPGATEDFMDAFPRAELLDSDIEEAFEKERGVPSMDEAKLLKQRLKGSSFFRRLKDDSSRPYDFRSYLNLAGVHNYMRWLANKYPGWVQVTSIGRGHEGRELLVMQIASGKLTQGSLAKKPSMWIDGGIHAREWISPATVLYFATQLAEGYADRSRNGRRARLFVDRLVWYFMPVMNPDGYEYSFTNDRLWRKNRRPVSMCDKSLQPGLIKCCDVGVDLNRNFDWFHCGEGASTNPCSEVYCGPWANSEPETQKVVEYLGKLKAERNLLGFLTFHSFSQYWMYPYGHTKGSYADNLQELRILSLNAARQIRKESGTDYKIGTSADLLYSAAGGSDDWAHGKLKVRFVFLIELPPCDTCREEFILPPDRIIPVGKETWRGVQAVAGKLIRTFESGRRKNRRQRRQQRRRQRRD